jgi:ribonuclease E
MAFIKSLLIASVATLAVAAPGYEYGSAQAKAVEQPAYGAAPAVQAPAYTAPKPAVKEPEVYEAPKPAVKEPEVYEAPKPAVKEPEVYAAPKPAVKEPEKYAAPTKKAMKQPEYKVDPVAAKAPAYAEPAIVQTVVIEEAVAPAPAPAVVEPAVVEPAVVAAPVVEEEPTTEIDVSSQESAPVCGNDQQLACCNSGEDLIGANCLSIPISKFPEISNLITLQNLILTRIL